MCFGSDRKVLMGDSIRSLKAIPLFAELTVPELERLSRLIEERTFEKNQVINQEDGPWEGLYIVKSGKVKVSKKASKKAIGRELIVTILEAGEPLNIAPLFEGGENVFTTQALGRVSVYYLSETNARAFVSDHPTVQKALLRALNMRVRQLASLASEVSFTGVNARLASWMLEQSRAKGIRTGRGIGIKRDLSLRELGSLMGTVGRVLSRSLAELRQDGVIEVTPDQIVILDQERLKAIAQGR